MILKRGYIQIYTGNGKGKTTAALGLALRMAGAGGRVLFAQFVKRRLCSEHLALIKLSSNIHVRQYGNGCFIKRKPNKRDLSLAKKGLEELFEILPSGDYDLVVLDEINIAIHHKLINVEEVSRLLNNKHHRTEVVLTGRHAHPTLIEMADLITEMTEIKHYSKKGLKARKGIEK